MGNKKATFGNSMGEKKSSMKSFKDFKGAVKSLITPKGKKK